VILFTSDMNQNEKLASKTSFIYLLISLFCILFGAVYEKFSHEVYSFYMIYAFVFPLVGGTLFFHILGLVNCKKYPRPFIRNLYHSGIATLTVGSFLQGILDIYGTTNVLINYYWLAGGSFLIIAILTYLLQIILSQNKFN